MCADTHPWPKHRYVELSGPWFPLPKRGTELSKQSIPADGGAIGFGLGQQG